MNGDIEDEEVDLGDLGLALVAASSIFANAERELTERKSEVINAMGKAKYGYVMKDGNKWVVAQRQSRGQGKPWLVVKGEK
jgi:hypothetical protein